VSVLAIVDEIAALLETDSTKRDGSAARPVDYLPDMLYIWPPTETFQRAGMDFGAEDQRDFRIRIAWATDAAGEVASELRTRVVTDTIHAKAEAYEAVVRGARAGVNYNWVEVSQVDYESLVTLTARGFYMDLSGYALPS
jgi:hypothetical protein